MSQASIFAGKFSRARRDEKVVKAFALVDTGTVVRVFVSGNQPFLVFVLFVSFICLFVSLFFFFCFGLLRARGVATMIVKRVIMSTITVIITSIMATIHSNGPEIMLPITNTDHHLLSFFLVLPLLLLLSLTSPSYPFALRLSSYLSSSLSLHSYPLSAICAFTSPLCTSLFLSFPPLPPFLTSPPHPFPSPLFPSSYTQPFLPSHPAPFPLSPPSLIPPPLDLPSPYILETEL